MRKNAGQRRKERMGEEERQREHTKAEREREKNKERLLPALQRLWV